MNVLYSSTASGQDTLVRVPSLFLLVTVVIVDCDVVTVSMIDMHRLSFHTRQLTLPDSDNNSLASSLTIDLLSAEIFFSLAGHLFLLERAVAMQ